MNVSLFDLFSDDSSTSLIIFEAVESPKLLVTLTFRTPDTLTQPLSASSPTPTLRGTLSPVSATVLRLDAPSMIVPSIGTRSPGRMTTISPGFTSLGSTTLTAPPRSTLAVSGRMSISALTACRLLSSAKSSKSSPTWKKSITKTASGNCGSAPGRNPMSKAPIVATHMRKSSLNGLRSLIPSSTASPITS